MIKKFFLVGLVWVDSGWVWLGSGVFDSAWLGWAGLGLAGFRSTLMGPAQPGLVWLGWARLRSAGIRTSLVWDRLGWSWLGLPQLEFDSKGLEHAGLCSAWLERTRMG